MLYLFYWKQKRKTSVGESDRSRPWGNAAAADNKMEIVVLEQPFYTYTTTKTNISSNFCPSPFFRRFENGKKIPVLFSN